MPKIFISYRRGDSLDATGRIDDRLAAHFGREEVFRDVDVIEPGSEFSTAIQDALKSCQVLLAIIGEDWVDAQSEDGRRRLEDDHDYVRLEIETALRRADREDIAIIPVLVRWGTLPKPERLPESLRPLLSRNATEVRSDRDFHSHVDRLIRDLERHLGPAAPKATVDGGEIRVVPKGLRSFDAEDADFFLDLLPGPRNRHGLPDSIRFWKTRIEETDPTKTFRVGLIYGPSGCGKSSLVKAGLLPRLAGHVTPIFVEATDDDTEPRLLNKLHRQYPDLTSDRDLEVTIKELADGRPLEASEKILIVIDQFEQWLQANQDVAKSEFLQALRHCDGERIQCVILVRDDFLTGASRFLRALNVHLSSERNVFFVDLLDADHARNILAAFGRAYGKLPSASQPLTPDQERFIEQAVEGLGEENRIVAVRLAVFADMLKEEPWEPDTLNELGGVQGVGVKFLEQKLESRTAHPMLRQYSKATRRTLKLLLPKLGQDIRGHRVSYQQLLDASEYSRREDEFDGLVKALDKEVRLITLTEADSESTADYEAASSRTKLYQLTHDYLVPSLREWLTRKQKETRRGRAELYLAEHAHLWKAKQERRFLPGPMTWTRILCFTSLRDWTDSQRRMMGHAAKFYSLFGGVLLLITFSVGWGTLNIVGGRTADAFVNRLSREEVETTVKEMIPEMTWFGRWAAPILEERLETPIPTDEITRHRLFREQSNAALALMAMGRYEAVWPLFKHGADPTRRSYLINRYAASGGDPGVLLERIGNESDSSIRRALILATGDFGNGQMSNADAFIKLLLKLYEQDPDPGIHGATDCVLRRWQREGWMAEKHRKQWETVRYRLATGKPQNDRQWYVTTTKAPLDGNTMSILEGSEYWYGKPPEKRKLNRRFAISTTEVTVKQFRRFLAATGREDVQLPEYSPQEDCPVNSVTWYSAAEYCNWLTEQENKSRADNEQLEKYYEPNESRKFTAGMKVHPQRNGYRLPTEEEWEYACRAGTLTPYFIGDAKELLVNYADYSPNVGDTNSTIAVACFKPNDFGLFDMHGNIYEWCQARPADREGDDWLESDELGGVLRGGSFANIAEGCQSASRLTLAPGLTDRNVGFRVARTYP